MDLEKKILCRFCFKILEDPNFQFINETIRNFLNTLLLNPDVDLAQKPPVCCDCVADLQKAFEFKSMFIYSKKFLVPVGNIPSSIKYDIGGHFLFPNNENNIICNGSKEITCEACAKFVPIDSISPTNEIKEFVGVWRDIFNRHLPEIILTTPENTVICVSCFASLKHYVSVIEKCLEAEDKIVKHQLSESLGNKNLNGFYVKTEGENFEVKYVKTENEEESDPLTKSAAFSEGKIKTEAWDFENPPSSQETLWIKTEPPTNDLSVNEIVSVTYEGNTEDVPSTYTEEVVKSSTNEDSADLKPFQCDLCEYRTKRKAHLKSHLQSHQRKAQRQAFKCHLCIFQAKYKSMLRKHMVVHTDPSQLTMFMCQICSYQTKYKGSLTGHMQKHNEEGYKCEVCGFETKYRKNLDRHMMTHKDPAEIPKFKCATCDFEARRKSHLSMHIAVKHRRASDVEKFQCEMCGFEFVSKSDFNRHNKTVHKDPSEITMYSCSECTFQTKYKDHLPRHMIIHKDVTEVVTYKCEFCPFQTKYENGIKGHLLLHSDSSEHPVYRCEECDFVTNRRQYLSRHRTVHKKEITT